MGILVGQLLTGLAGAASLFLVAAGLTVIFGVTRIVNFAHGSLTMLGAYIGWTVLSYLPRSPSGFVAGAIITALATALIGVAIEMTLLRRIYRAPELFQLLATFGVVLVVADIVPMIWGPADLTIARPSWMRGFVSVLGERFPSFDLVLIAVGPAVLLALFLLFRRTRWGTLVRAATADREMVSALGVDQRLLFTTVFALGAGLAGLGGCLMLPDGSANTGIDLGVIADAFVVVVLGGLGSVTGAYLAACLVGVAQAFGVALLPKTTLVLTFALMAAVLAVRPNGLLGRAEATDAGVVEGAGALLRPAGRIERIVGLLALIAAMLAPFIVGPFVLSVLTEAAIAILFAASLHVMMGPGGMPSFGHAAWFGIGAYGAALAVGAFGMAGALLVATLAAAAAALLFGAAVARLSGVYLAMLTLAFAQIVWAIAVQFVSLTGGDDGLLGIRPSAWLAGSAALYWLSLGLGVGGAMLLRCVVFAPLGYAVRASRDSAGRAAAIGLDTARLRLVAIVLAGAGGGLAGGLFAFAKASVFPTYVAIGRSVDGLVMVLLGGVGAISGPVLGAIAYTGLYDGLLLLTGEWRLVLGLAIIALVLAFPDGLAGAASRLMRARTGRDESC